LAEERAYLAQLHLHHEQAVLVQKRLMLQQAYAHLAGVAGPASFSSLQNSAHPMRKTSDASEVSTAMCSSQASESTGVSSMASDSSSSEDSDEEAVVQEKTTVMMRNIPNGLSRDNLLQLMDRRGFAGTYDLVYLPVDFGSLKAFGYAFINFTSAVHASSFREHFQGFRTWGVPSTKVCDVLWAMTHQGLAANIERYRNCPVMHGSVPERFKPVLFVDGVRTSFPTPTRKLRAPQTSNRAS